MYKKVLDSKCDRDICTKITGMLIDREIFELEEIIDMLLKQKSFN